MSTYNIVFSKSLMHYGIPKMVHGVRRFQYPDGSLTPEGRIRYGREKQKILSTRDHPDDPNEIAKAERQAMAQIYDDRIKELEWRIYIYLDETRTKVV